MYLNVESNQILDGLRLHSGHDLVPVNLHIAKKEVQTHTINMGHFDFSNFSLSISDRS